MKGRQITKNFISSVFTKCFKNLLPEKLQFYLGECFPTSPPKCFSKWDNKALFHSFISSEGTLVGLPFLGHFSPPFYHCTIERKQEGVRPLPRQASQQGLRVLNQKCLLITAVQNLPLALHQCYTISDLCFQENHHLTPSMHFTYSLHNRAFNQAQLQRDTEV